MPSRKSQGSEDSSRQSLPRLASIASFQALNPFNRRRSNNATDASTATSSSKVSTSTSRTTSLGLRSLNASVSSVQDVVSGPQLLPKPWETNTESMLDLPTSKRADYMQLADEQTTSIPRSRTFSNLPLPSRMTKKPIPMAASKSHTRLPSLVRPPSRIPSPPITNRKHTNPAVGGSTAVGRAHISKQLQRSDTMPLLQLDTEQLCTTPRSAGFKENIALSSAKSTPRAGRKGGFWGSSTPAKKLADDEAWFDSQESLGGSNIPQPQESLTSLPLSRYAPHPAFRSKPYLSSPAYKPSAERLPIPGAPVQRWASQPAMVFQPNPRHSTHGEIKQARLLSTRAPPTPPPPTTPLNASQSSATPARHHNLNNSGHLRHRSEQSPTFAFNCAVTSEVLPRAPPPSLANTTAPTSRAPTPPPGTLARHEPTAYWAGRFSALNDRYRNEEMQAHLAPSMYSPRNPPDDMHTPAATTARQRRALEYLHGLCVTDDARASFLVFQLYIAHQLNSAELGRGFANLHPILRAERERQWREQTAKAREAREAEAREQQVRMDFQEPRTPVTVLSAGGVGGDGPAVGSAGSARARSEGRKASFMERLLGRKKRPSGSEATP